MWIVKKCVCKSVYIPGILLQFKGQSSCCRETELLLSRYHCPLSISKPLGATRGIKVWRFDRWHVHLVQLYIRMSGWLWRLRSVFCFAQWSACEMATGVCLENVRNEISKKDISLNTVFSSEFPEQNVVYVYFGNFQWVFSSNTCPVFWFEHVYIYCINSNI